MLQRKTWGALLRRRMAVHGGAQPFKRRGGAGDADRRDRRAGLIVDANGAGDFPKRRAGARPPPRRRRTAFARLLRSMTSASFCSTISFSGIFQRSAVRSDLLRAALVKRLRVQRRDFQRLFLRIGVLVDADDGIAPARRRP